VKFEPTSDGITAPSAPVVSGSFTTYWRFI